MYLLDIIRSTPPDLNYTPDSLALLRPELISEYIQHLKTKKRLQLKQQQKQLMLKQQQRRGQNTTFEGIMRDEEIEKIVRYVFSLLSSCCFFLTHVVGCPLHSTWTWMFPYVLACLQLRRWPLHLFYLLQSWEVRRGTTKTIWIRSERFAITWKNQ